MQAPRFVRPLDTTELAALQERYRTTNDADERSRCQMLLFSAQGKSVPEIAALTCFDADTVLFWLGRYEAEGLSGLATKPRPGRPPKSRCICCRVFAAAGPSVAASAKCSRQARTRNATATAR